MKQKQGMLLRFLMEKEVPITAKELSNYLKVSIRMVKSYISFVNKDAQLTLISSSYKGV